MPTFGSFRRTFQRALDRRVAEASLRAVRLTRDAGVRSVVAHAAKIVRKDGKRLRPYLALLMYRACGGRHVAEALRRSITLELFHAFALVHDDVMDRGTLRHGLPTVQVEVARRLARSRGVGDLAHVGESQAILAGDLLLAWAHDLLAAPGSITPERRRDATRVFDAMAEEVIVGQMLDVDLATRPSASRALVMEKMRRKTAGYSFVKPLQFGAALAGADRKTLRWCEAFGTAVGLAFQIQDDLLDLEAPSSRSHKTPFSDLRERQQTIFTQEIFEHGTPAERRELRALMGAVLNEKDRPRVRRLFERSGAIAHGRSLIDRYLTQAEGLLGRADLSRSSRAEFIELLRTVRDRVR